MLKKCFILILVLISLPSWASTDYEAELIKFVNKLNTIFSLEIKTQKREICAFGANLTTIVYCQKDIDVFKTLGPEEKPLESLFTIIGHEYAHILLDYDKTSEGRIVFQESFDSSLNLILAKIQNDPFRIQQIEKSVYRNRSITFKEKVSDFLGLIQHENIDALGAKLVILTGYEPNPKSSQLMLRFEETQNNPVFRTWITPRENIIQVSKDDGLDRWSNFRCLGSAFTYMDSNLLLRRGLAALGQDRFLFDLNQGCSVDDSIVTFFERLDFYYP